MSLAQSTLWLPGSPASLPVLRVSAEVRLMLDGSGRKSRASFAPASPLGSCLKTFLASSVWDSMTYSAIWTARATKARRVFIRLRRLGRRTSGNGSSSWPAVWASPTASTGDNQPAPPVLDGRAWYQQPQAARNLAAMAETRPVVLASAWPTPTADNAKNNRRLHMDGTPYSTSSSYGVTLLDAVLFWPTPQARDYRSPDAPDSPRTARKAQQGWSLNLNDVAGLWSTPAAQDAKNATLPASQATRDTLPGDLLRANTVGRLNPAWVAQLMGYPDGWLDIPSTPTDGPHAPVKRSTSGKRRAPSRRATEHPGAPRS